MSILINYLHSEFVALCAEVKRKNHGHGAKESLERAISYLSESIKNKKNISPSDFDVSQFDFLQPLLLVYDGKNAKMMTIIIGCIQKLITHRVYLNEDRLSRVLHLFHKAIDMNVEIQLKILQALLPLLNHYAGLIHQENIMLIFNLGFHFANQSKTSPMIYHSANATVRQMVVFLFERMELLEPIKRDVKKDALLENKDNAGEQAKLLDATIDVLLDNQAQIVPGGDVKEHKDLKDSLLKSSALDAYCIFKDLCFLCNGERAPFLGISNTVASADFALELIDSILSLHSDSFKDRSEFLLLLKDPLCVILMKNFKLHKENYYLAIRYYRLFGVMIKQFSNTMITECEIFLTLLLRVIHHSSLSWHTILGLEVCRFYVFSSWSLVSLLYVQYEKGRIEGQPGLLDIYFLSIDSMLNCILEARLQEDLDSKRDHEWALSLKVPWLKLAWIEQLEKTEPPFHISIPIYASLVILQTVMGIVQQLSDTLPLSPYNSMIQGGGFPILSRDSSAQDRAHQDQDSDTMATVDALSCIYDRVADILFKYYSMNYEDDKEVNDGSHSHSKISSGVSSYDKILEALRNWTLIGWAVLRYHAGKTIKNWTSQIVNAFTVLLLQKGDDYPRLWSSCQVFFSLIMRIKSEIKDAVLWQCIIEVNMMIDIYRLVNYATRTQEQPPYEQLALILSGGEWGPMVSDSFLSFVRAFGAVLVNLFQGGHWELIDGSLLMSTLSLLGSKSGGVLRASGSQSAPLTPLYRETKLTWRDDVTLYFLKKYRETLLNHSYVFFYTKGQSEGVGRQQLASSHSFNTTLWDTIVSQTLLHSILTPGTSLTIQYECLQCLTAVIESLCAYHGTPPREGANENSSVEQGKTCHCIALMLAPLVKLMKHKWYVDLGTGDTRNPASSSPSPLSPMNLLGDECKKEVLKYLHSFLVNYSEAIVDEQGWHAVLDVLSSFIEEDSGGGFLLTVSMFDLIILGFPCIQLICMECLPTFIDCRPASQQEPPMSPTRTIDLMHRVIDILCSYARHSNELNLSLTCMGLLWNVSDVILLKSKVEDSDISVSLKRQRLALLKALLELAVLRPPKGKDEIMEAGIQTLFRTVIIHGGGGSGAVGVDIASGMSLDEWGVLLDDILRPIVQLGIVFSCGRSSVSDSGECVREIGGGGQTSLFCLNGLADVMLTFPSIFVALPNVESFWNAYWDALTRVACCPCLLNKGSARGTAGSEGHWKLRNVALKAAIRLLAPDSAAQIHPRWTQWCTLTWTHWERICQSIPVVPEPDALATETAFTCPFSQESLILLMTWYTSYVSLGSMNPARIIHCFYGLVRATLPAKEITLDKDAATQLQSSVWSAMIALCTRQGVTPDFIAFVVRVFRVAFDLGESCSMQTGPPSSSCTLIGLAKLILATLPEQCLPSLYTISDHERNMSLWVALLQAYRIPLKQKWASSLASQWTLALQSYLTVTLLLLDVKRENNDSGHVIHGLWSEVIGFGLPFILDAPSSSDDANMTNDRMNVRTEWEESLETICIDVLESYICPKLLLLLSNDENENKDIVLGLWTLLIELTKEMDGPSPKDFDTSHILQNGTASNMVMGEEAQLGSGADKMRISDATTTTSAKPSSQRYIRERMVSVIWGLLFDILHDNKAAQERGSLAIHMANQNELSLQRLAQLLYPLWLARVSVILNHYIALKKCTGSFPLSTRQHKEILMICAQCANLHLKPGLCKTAPPVVRRAFESPPSPPAHLVAWHHCFYFYHEWIVMMTFKEDKLPPILQRILHRIGHAMGWCHSEGPSDCPHCTCA